MSSDAEARQLQEEIDLFFKVVEELVSRQPRLRLGKEALAVQTTENEEIVIPEITRYEEDEVWEIEEENGDGVHAGTVPLPR